MVNAYLKFDGQAAAAFELYQSVLGGTITRMQRYGDTPHGEQLSPEDKQKVMHMQLESEKGWLLMGSDHMEGMMGIPYAKGNNFSMAILPGSEQQADELFNGLAAGGTITFPIQKVFWGAYFGMLIDKFGVEWQINYEGKK